MKSQHYPEEFPVDHDEETTGDPSVLSSSERVCQGWRGEDQQA